MPHESGGSGSGPYESEIFSSRRTRICLIYCVLVSILYFGGVSCRPNPQFQLPFRLPSFLGPAFSSVQNLPVPNGLRRHSQQHIDAGLEYGRQHRRILLPHIYRVGERPNASPGQKSLHPHQSSPGNGHGQGQGQSTNEPLIIAMSHPIYPVQNLPREPLMEAGSQLQPVYGQPQLTIPKHIPIPVPVPMNFIPANPEIIEQRMREEAFRFPDPNHHNPEVDHVHNHHHNHDPEREHEHHNNHDHDHHNNHEHEHEYNNHHERNFDHGHRHHFEDRDRHSASAQPQPPPKVTSAHIFEPPTQPPPKPMTQPSANVLYQNPEFGPPKVHLIEISKSKELEHPKVKEFLQSLFPSLDASQSPSSNNFEIRSPPPSAQTVTGTSSQDFVVPIPMAEHIEHPQLHQEVLQPNANQNQNQILSFEHQTHTESPPKPPVDPSHPDNSAPYTFYSKSPLIQHNSQYLITFKQTEDASTQTGVPLSTIPILGHTELYPGAPMSSPATLPMMTTLEASPEISTSPTHGPVVPFGSISPIPHDELINPPRVESMEAEADVSNSIEENIKAAAAPMQGQTKETVPADTDQSMSATIQFPFPLLKLSKKHFQFVSEKVDVKSVFGSTTPEPEEITTRVPSSLSIGLQNAVDRILRGEPAKPATTTTVTPESSEVTTRRTSRPKTVQSGKFKNLTAVLVENPEDFSQQFSGLGKNSTIEAPFGQRLDINHQQIVEFRSRLESLPLGKRSGQINGNEFGGRPPIPKEEDIQDYDEEKVVAFNSNKTNEVINDNKNNLIPDSISTTNPMPVEPVAPTALPNIPEIPKVTAGPSIPEIPQVITDQTLQEIPKVIDGPSIPEIPQVIADQTIPEIQSVTTASTTPEIPAVTNSPIIPEIPKVNIAPIISEVQSITTTALIPGIPEVTTATTIAEIPEVTNAPIIPEIPEVTPVPIVPESDVQVTTARIRMPIIAPNLTITNENKVERKPVEDDVQDFRIEGNIDADHLLDAAARFRYADQYPQSVSDPTIIDSQNLVSRGNVPGENQNPSVVLSFPDIPGPIVRLEFPLNTTQPTISWGQTNLPEVISNTSAPDSAQSIPEIISSTSSTTTTNPPEIIQEESTTPVPATSTSSPDITSSTNPPISIILPINSTDPSPEVQQQQTTEEDGSDMMSSSIGAALAEMGIEIVSSPSPADPVESAQQEQEISSTSTSTPAPTEESSTSNNEIVESTSPSGISGMEMLQELLSGFMSRSTPEAPVATVTPESIQNLISETTTEISTTTTTTTTTESPVNRGMMLIQKFISDMMMTKSEPDSGKEVSSGSSEGTKAEPETETTPMSIIPTTEPSPTEMAESGQKLINEMLSQMVSGPGQSSPSVITFPDSSSTMGPFPDPPRLRPTAPVGLRRKRPNFATVLGTKQQPVQINSFITPMLSDTPLRPRIPSTAAQTRRQKLKQVLGVMNRNNADAETQPPLQRLPMFSSPPSIIPAMAPTDTDDSNSIEPESVELNLQIPARGPGSILRPTPTGIIPESDSDFPTRSTTSLPAFHKVTRITTTLATTSAPAEVTTTFRHSRRRFKQQPIRSGDYNNYRMRKLGEFSTTTTTEVPTTASTQKPKIRPRKKNGYAYAEPTRPLIVFPPPRPDKILTPTTSKTTTTTPSTTTTTTTPSTTTTTTTTTSTTTIKPPPTQNRFGGESSEESVENYFYHDYSDLPPASMPMSDSSEEVEQPLLKSTSRPPRIQIKSSTSTTTTSTSTTPEPEIMIQAEMMSSNEIPKSLESEEKMDNAGSKSEEKMESSGSSSMSIGSSEIPAQIAEKKPPTSEDYLLDYEDNLSKGAKPGLNLPAASASVPPPVDNKDDPTHINFDDKNSVRLMHSKSQEEPPSLPAIGDISESYDDLPPLPGSFEEDNKNFGLKAGGSNLGRPPPPGLPLSDYEEEPEMPPVPIPPSTTTTEKPTTTTSTTTITSTTTTTTTTESPTTTTTTTTEPPSISVDPAIFAKVPESTSEATLETIKPNVESKRKKMSKVTKTGPSYSAMTVEITRPLTPPTASPTPSNEDWLREVALKALDRGISFQQVFSINIGHILLRRTSMAEGEDEVTATTPYYVTPTEAITDYDKENANEVNLAPTETMVSSGTSYVMPQSSSTIPMITVSSISKYPPIFAMRSPVYIAPSEKPVVEDVPFKFTPDYAPPPIAISKKSLQIESANATEKAVTTTTSEPPPASSYSDEEYFDESFESRLRRMSNSARSVKLTRLWRRNGGER